MTTVQIQSGICGFSTTVRVFKSEKKKLNVFIESTCEFIERLNNQLQNLSIRDVLKNPINRNPVYVNAGLCNLHASCPVPCGIIKAAEVELGLALKRNVEIAYL